MMTLNIAVDSEMYINFTAQRSEGFTASVFRAAVDGCMGGGKGYHEQWKGRWWWGGGRAWSAASARLSSALPTNQSSKQLASLPTS